MELYYEEKRQQWDDGIAYLQQLQIKCHICHKPFNIDRSDRVSDQDHVTANYRDPAQIWCYFPLRRTCKITIFFQNFRGYNSHFIVMAMTVFPGADIEVTGQAMEKYLTISIGKYLVFKSCHTRQEPEED